MRLLYFGSGEFGVPTLERLHRDHQLLAVVTQPDRPAGRRRTPTPTPVANWAGINGIETLKLDNANAPEAVAQIAAFEAEASVVIAFGQKLSPELIMAGGELVVNLHASLLPAYRGAAPINWAMINGEKKTGVSVIALAQRMDAGAVYHQASLDIDSSETAGELHDRLALLGPDAIAGTLEEFTTGQLSGLTQDDALSSKAPKMSKADGTVSFDQSADAVRARIHGLTPWPGCRVTWHRRALGKDEALILHRVAVDPFIIETHHTPGVVIDHAGRIATADGENVVRLLEVQTPGGKLLSFAEFSNGKPLEPGDTLRAIEQTSA